MSGAETAKLAHVLTVPAGALSMLAGVPDADVRALRRQVAEALFQADRHYFVRMAALSRTVPGAVTAKLTELALPPLLAARTAELLEPARAVDLVGRLSLRYLTDVSAVLDPARAKQVVAALPADRVAAVAAELARRAEWIVLGGFASYVSAEALTAAVAVLDGGQLLRTGYAMDEPGRVDDVGALLTDAQLDAMLAAAVSLALWPELTAVVGMLGASPTARLAARLRAADEGVRAGFRAAVRRGDLPAAALDELGGP